MNPALCGLAANPALPPDLLDRLIEAADEELAFELAQRTDLTCDRIRRLAAGSESAAVRLAYEGRLRAGDIDPAQHPRAALALLEEGAGPSQWAWLFVEDPRVERREKLAACPDLPPEVARALAVDSDVRIVVELALWTPMPLLAELAHHPHADVRRAVAGNEHTPPELLAALLTGEGIASARSCRVCDQEQVPFVHAPDCPRTDCALLPGDACDGSHQSVVHNMQWQALKNPVTPLWAVVRFVDHPSALLRELVAEREGLPDSVYEQLAQDPTPMVRATLAKNPSISDGLVRRLAEDRTHNVQWSLSRQPELPLDVLALLAQATKLGSPLLPRIEAATPAEVAGLARAADPTLRMLVALRRDLPGPIRDALADDPDAKVVKAIAPHPGLAEAQLLAVIDRHGPRVASKVATNPGATATVLLRLAELPAAARKVFREIARHPNAPLPALLACLADPRARHIAAGRPELPGDVLVDLLTDEDRQVAEAAGANPSLPVEAMRSVQLV